MYMYMYIYILLALGFLHGNIPYEERETPRGPPGRPQCDKGMQWVDSSCYNLLSIYWRKRPNLVQSPATDSPSCSLRGGTATVYTEINMQRREKNVPDRRCTVGECYGVLRVSLIYPAESAVYILSIKGKAIFCRCSKHLCAQHDYAMCIGHRKNNRMLLEIWQIYVKGFGQVSVECDDMLIDCECRAISILQQIHARQLCGKDRLCDCDDHFVYQHVVHSS